METKKFKKTVENFLCDHCGIHIDGDGYTNHCPQCLWSKHVDIYPGDRMQKCAGLMRPIEIDYQGGQGIINFRCEKCGFERKNKVDPLDNSDAIISFFKNQV